MDRVDSLIAELSVRHRNTDPEFLAAVRPMVVAILDPATPDASRVPLLELLAETFERDVQVRRDAAAARAAWTGFVEVIRKLLRG
ncbi:MAG: hypothetical protein KAI24_07085 [Planctomycetes bacterium]|nr:hypothetical protein [Planctomycetota bacterium]